MAIHSVEAEWQRMRMTVPSGGVLQSGVLLWKCVSYSRMKILIAEDDKDSRELLSWLLQKLGYQVVATEKVAPVPWAAASADCFSTEAISTGKAGPILWGGG